MEINPNGMRCTQCVQNAHIVCSLCVNGFRDKYTHDMAIKSEIVLYIIIRIVTVMDKTIQQSVGHNGDPTRKQAVFSTRMIVLA